MAYSPPARRMARPPGAGRKGHGARRAGRKARAHGARRNGRKAGGGGGSIQKNNFTLNSSLIHAIFYEPHKAHSALCPVRNALHFAQFHFLCYNKNITIKL